MASTFNDMKSDIETDWDEVLWSESYGWGDATALAACVYFQCATTYLGQRLEDLATKVGKDLLEQTLRNKGTVLTGPGNFQAVTPDGGLEFYRDLARNGTANWAHSGQGKRIGTGWQNFKFVFGGQDGIIYAVTPDGGLEFYRDLARNGTANWAHSGQGKRIGTGWQNFKFVFGGDNGIIYTVNR